MGIEAVVEYDCLISHWCQHECTASLLTSKLMITSSLKGELHIENISANGDRKSYRTVPMISLKQCIHPYIDLYNLSCDIQ